MTRGGKLKMENIAGILYYALSGFVVRCPPLGSPSPDESKPDGTPGTVLSSIWLAYFPFLIFGEAAGTGSRCRSTQR